jgi:hypothetical protein
MTKRVFTYGCSITQHVWPTWADIVLHSARISGYSVFNAGLSGIGNTGIKRSVIQTHEKYRITEEDLLLVMWSSFLREDRITNYHCHDDPSKQRNLKTNNLVRHSQSGNVLNTEFYTKDFIRNYFNIEHYIINSISEISIVRKAFNLLFEGHFSLSEGVIEDDSRIFPHKRMTDDSDGVYTVHDMLLNDLKLPNPWHIGKNYMVDSPYAPWYLADGHPVPAEALEYVLNYIEPLLPFSIKTETIEWIATWNRLLLEQIRLHSEGIDKKRTTWQPIFIDEMYRYNQTNGINTNIDIWGGTKDDEGLIDVPSIIENFIKNSEENS